MSLAALWDRFWWSLMLAIFIGVLWLKLIDPVFRRTLVGAAAALAAGAVYFAVGLRRMLLQKKREDEVERKAREELVAENVRETIH